MSTPETIVAVAAIAGVVAVVYALIWGIVNSAPAPPAPEYTFQWVVTERKEQDQQAALAEGDEGCQQ